MSIDEVVAEVDRFQAPLVEVTGGEPLLQPDVYPLMEALLDRGHTVLLETGGHISVARVPPEVWRIIDVTCPGSGEAHRMDWDNLQRLQPHDEVKFVIRDRVDYEYARSIVTDRQLAGAARAVLFSPVHGVLDPKTLANWILEDRLPVQVQLQMHKYIWEPDTRGV
jgi:7-carboxy-7-deazaguanine synthase